MTATMQVLMSVFTIAGFVLAKVHTYMSSPVGRDVLKLLGEAADQHAKVQAHGKLKALFSHNTALFKDLAVMKHSADDGAHKAGGSTSDAELEAVVAQAKALYLSNKQQQFK